MAEVDEFIKDVANNFYFFGDLMQKYARATARGDRQSAELDTAQAVTEGVKMAIRIGLAARKTFVPNRTKFAHATLDVILDYMHFVDAFAREPSEHGRVQDLFLKQKYDYLRAYFDLSKAPQSNSEGVAKKFARSVVRMVNYLEEALEISVDNQYWKKIDVARRLYLSLVASAVYAFQAEVGRQKAHLDKVSFTNQFTPDVVIDLLRNPILEILRRRNLSAEEIVKRIIVTSKNANDIANNYFTRMTRSANALLILGDEEEED